MIVSPKTTHGAVGLYQCKDGFKLQGRNTTKCEFGTWSGVTPVCQELYCQFPGYLSNGRILLVGNMGLYDYRPYVKKITNDRQIMFDCNKGFILSFGSPQGATCIGGTWSPETVPVCIPENHPHIRWLDKRSIRKEVLEKLFPSSLLPSSTSSPSSPLLSSTSTPSSRLLSSTLRPAPPLLSSTSFPISPIRWKANPSEEGNTNLPEEGRAALPEPQLKPLQTNLAYIPRFVENIESKKYLKRALRRVLRRKRNVNGLEKNENIKKEMNDEDCSELNAENLNIDMLKHQARSNSTKYNADGVTLYVSCKKGFILNSTRNKIECLSGKWKPAIPVCTPLPCTLHQDHMINYRSAATELKAGESVEYECKKGYSPQNSSLQVTCTAGALVPTPVCLGDSCTVPKLQNGEYTKEVSAGDRIKHDVLLEYSCIPGYQKPTPNPLQCKGGRLIPFEPECIEESDAARAEPLISNMLEEEFCNYSTEEENLVAFLGDRMLSSEDIIPEGSKVVFRCSDIGKFKLIGASHLLCKSGVLSENVPTCEGLNQQYNYAEELPPTVLFRHENGPIAQSNTGALLVYPKTTLHMECLFQKKNGQPRWIPTNSTKKTYPQGWAQGHMRDSTLEYRLSIYHASSQDSGEYTCITPLNNSHSIQIQVVALDCPTINLTNGLVSSTTVTRLGTVVRFSCNNSNSLVGAQNLRCLPTGKWNGLIPTCDQITCPDIKTIIKDPVVKITSTENESNGRVYLACPRGFRINGDTRAFCQPNGEWSLSSPSTCKPISCRSV
ncbi:sushi, von Willebrand factor type A, EGF and pentraxin domain-containing protein 1 [Eurytemora carolleeae]|uniref:sushi, von Willebrand factor type A, EGF and pentraxin domain-containing protein 1 n=1 Tax=Eurytemora carolleeae TaxID=1294199 RepID=UPI000C76AA17|nr:sushi, von Willebrand factor type A, EGF and pentraxin domain-containing protein 1 [Eurytemora carolleeae]|eukprot:XP_023331995.1 sushi, von Willebrand factor type A, EGF and pentraxin domain-containing protein 1-like [Eurytemora affinis]